MFIFRKFIKSFVHAFHGLAITYREEQSFRAQLFAGALAAILAVYFKVKSWEAVLLILVLVLELLNSAIERLIDAAKPRLHIAVQAIKDMMAAAVLIASLGALVIGVIIFYPHFADTIKGILDSKF